MPLQRLLAVGFLDNSIVSVARHAENLVRVGHEYSAARGQSQCSFFAKVFLASALRRRVAPQMSSLRKFSRCPARGRQLSLSVGRLRAPPRMICVKSIVLLLVLTTRAHAKEFATLHVTASAPWVSDVAVEAAALLHESHGTSLQFWSGVC